MRLTENGQLLDEEPPEEVKRRRRENQAMMAERWGSNFTAMAVHSFGFCPSQDGSMIGIEFVRPDGTSTRVSMPINWFVGFFLETQLALETAAERLNEWCSESGADPGETGPARH